MRLVWWTFAIGTALRLLAIPFSSPEYSFPFWNTYGWPADHANYVQWARQATAPEYGLSTIYTIPPERLVKVRLSYGEDFVHYGNHDIANYPPLGIYLVYLQGVLHRRLDPELVANTAVARAVFDVFSLIGDILLAWGVWRLAGVLFGRRAASMAFAVVYLMPPIWLDSCWWGQTDSWEMAPMVWIVWAMVGRRWLLSGLLWGMALSLKPQAVLLVPIWGFVWVASLTPTWKRHFKDRPRRDAARIVLAVVLAAMVLNIAALPFWLTSGEAWLYQSYFRNLTAEAPYTTMRAFNIWYIDLLMTYDADVTGTIAGITKDTWGKLLLIAGICLSAGMAWRSRLAAPSRVVVFAALWLLAVVMLPTRVHERYIVMCLPFLVVVATGLKRLWPSVIALIVVGCFQLCSYHWLVLSADTWTRKWVDEAIAYNQKVFGDTDPEYRHLVPSEEEALQMRFEVFLDEHRPFVPWEWGLTIVALVAATGTFLSTARSSRISAEKNRNRERADLSDGTILPTTENATWPNQEDVQLVHASSDDQFAEAKKLVVEYAEWLGVDLSFQDFDRELAEFPGDYAPPDGCILMAYIDGQIAGCVALCKSAEGICEMKRLFVRQAYRRRGLGKRLAVAVIEEARKRGHERMRLDTLSWMTEAIGLYESLGFTDIEPYRHNPMKDAKFMEVIL